MSDHDQLFKTLIHRFFGDLVSIVVPEMARRMRLDRPTFLESEHFTDLPEGRRRRLDLIAEVETAEAGTEIILVHVEIESRSRGRTMDDRMWRYAMQLWLRHGRPVVPIVVFLVGGRPDVSRTTVEHRFVEVHLASFTYFAFRFLLANCVETYVQWNNEAADEYEALLAAHENREVNAMQMTWADRMRSEYETAGRELGRIEGMRSLVTGMIETRFGPVPADQRRRIDAIDSPDELTRLADRLLTASSLDDLEI